MNKPFKEKTVKVQVNFINKGIHCLQQDTEVNTSATDIIRVIYDYQAFNTPETAGVWLQKYDSTKQTTLKAYRKIIFIYCLMKVQPCIRKQCIPQMIPVQFSYQITIYNHIQKIIEYFTKKGIIIIPV